MTPKQRTALRRFEFTTGGSNKFWEVYCVGSIMFARWGRIGSKGQSKEWGYGSTAAARSMASRKANEKIRKGYAEVEAALFKAQTGTEVISPTKKKAKPKPKKQERKAEEPVFRRSGPKIGWPTK